MLSPLESECWRTGNARFTTTRWSVVLAARGKATAESREALALLCEAYWFPVYAYVRRQGYDVENAQDLTQGFFAGILEKDGLRSIQRQGGKFRSYLLSMAHHYISNEQARAQAQKRGGGRLTLSLDFQEAETRYRPLAVDRLTPERMFERRWAEEVLGRAMNRLERIWNERGKQRQFDHLRAFLTGERPAKSYGELAAVLEMTEAALRVAVHRLRGRYADLVREEVAQTLAAPGEIDDELRYLMSCFG